MKKHTDRILILSQYYPPETGAPQNRLSDLAVGFKDAGYDVRVLTAKPNYPIGKIYPGYEKGFVQNSVQEGIPVTHCWIYPSNKSLFHRLINYLSFVFSSIIIGLFRLPKLDLIIMESPPLFLSFSGWFLSRIKGAKLVLNISDIYPDTAISLGLIKNKLIIKLFYWLEAWSYKISALITGQTRGIVSSIEYRFPERKIYLLTNGIRIKNSGENNEARIEKSFRNSNDFIIGYAGIIGYGQGLDNLFESAKLIQKNPAIKIHIYGDGPLKSDLGKKAERLSLRNIEFMGHYPHQEILEIMSAWDVGLVSLEDIPIMSGALPSKMFEMMAMRLPILLIAPRGEASLIIEEANAGICLTPDSPGEIAQAIQKLFEDEVLRKQLGENAYHCVCSDFNREHIFQKFLAYLRDEQLLS